MRWFVFGPELRSVRETEEQIGVALRQADAGTSVGDICRKLGISEPTFYRSKPAGLGSAVSRHRAAVTGVRCPFGVRIITPAARQALQ